MKRNKIALATTSGILGLSVLAGSMAFANSNSNGDSAAELQRFLTANPSLSAAVTSVQTQTGGQVVGAEFDDEAANNAVVEFDVKLADGSEQHVLYTVADGTMAVQAAEQGDGDHDGDGDQGDRDGDHDRGQNGDGDHDGDGDGEMNDDN